MTLLEEGLCMACVHARKINAERNTYILCEYAKKDQRYRKYPPIPVLRCDAFVYQNPTPEALSREDNAVPKGSEAAR